MYVKPTLTPPENVWTATAAALAAVIAIGLLTLTIEAFRSRGTPFQELAVAERSCSAHPYVSEREACIRDDLVAKQGESVARESARDD